MRVFLLTAHKVVNHGVDGAVEVAQPMGDESSGNRVIVLRQFDCVSAPTGRKIKKTKQMRNFENNCIITLLVNMMTWNPGNSQGTLGTPSPLIKMRNAERKLPENAD